MREVEAAEWDAFPDLDAYYRRPYVESAAVLEGGRAFLLEHEGTVFAGVEREAPRDVVTPYGYGGPTGPGFWPAYEEWARERGLVSTFVRFHPLYGNHRDAPIHVEPLAPTVAPALTALLTLLRCLKCSPASRSRSGSSRQATVGASCST